MLKTEQVPNLARFLLVEDDPDHADLIVRALADQRVSNQFDHVTDGEAAIKFLRKEPPYENASRPDVVLLDLNLPKVNGHEVLRAIKDDPDLKAIPVVVLTTSAAEADRAKAYQNYANSYLSKPIDFSQFHEMIKDLKMYWGVWNLPG